ncbi:hypothetical protein QE152_g84 [Popillia japonica]|uniref:Uncharacterized protein n=1 Tax=Popillia japonica TaxID=7064 RepID=A0AAW1NL24_POPJA
MHFILYRIDSRKGPLSLEEHTSIAINLSDIDTDSSDIESDSDDNVKEKDFTVASDDKDSTSFEEEMVNRESTAASNKEAMGEIFGEEVALRPNLYVLQPSQQAPPLLSHAPPNA